jgi:hypothetical protein
LNALASKANNTKCTNGKKAKGQRGKGKRGKPKANSQSTLKQLEGIDIILSLLSHQHFNNISFTFTQLLPVLLTVVLKEHDQLTPNMKKLISLMKPSFFGIVLQKLVNSLPCTVDNVNKYSYLWDRPSTCGAHVADLGELDDLITIPIKEHQEALSNQEVLIQKLTTEAASLKLQLLKAEKLLQQEQYKHKETQQKMQQQINQLNEQLRGLLLSDAAPTSCSSYPQEHSVMLSSSTVPQSRPISYMSPSTAPQSPHIPFMSPSTQPQSQPIANSYMYMSPSTAPQSPHIPFMSPSTAPQSPHIPFMSSSTAPQFQPNPFFPAPSHVQQFINCSIKTPLSETKWSIEEQEALARIITDHPQSDIDALANLHNQAGNYPRNRNQITYVLTTAFTSACEKLKQATKIWKRARRGSG